MHPLLILVLIFDVLIAVSSVLNLVNMMRVNLLVEERKAEAFTVERVRVSKAAAGKGASLPPILACILVRAKLARVNSPLRTPTAVRSLYLKPLP